MNKDFKRMMELAGLTEIKVSDPGILPATYIKLRDYNWSLLAYAIDALNETGIHKRENYLKTFLGFFSYDDYLINPNNWNLPLPKNDIEALDMLLENEYGMNDKSDREEASKLLLEFFGKYNKGYFQYEGYGPNDDVGDLSQYRFLDKLGVLDEEYGDFIVVSNIVDIGENPYKDLEN